MYVHTYYRVADIRDIDAEPMPQSPHLDDKVLAILMRTGDRRKAVRQVLRRLATAEPEERSTAFRELALLAGLEKFRRNKRRED